MLGFTDDKKRTTLSGKFLKEYLETLKRYRTKQFNEEDLKRIAWENKTPEHEIIWEDVKDENDPMYISNMCRVCDYYRDEKICKGKRFKCEKFVNRFDNNPIEQARPTTDELMKTQKHNNNENSIS